MLRTVGIFMLMLQLRPFAAAAVCVHESRGTEQPCDMPMGALPASESPGQPHHATPPGHSSDCPLVQLCALTSPVVIPAIAAGAATVRVSLASVGLDYVASKHTADPVAPPVPPPNS